MRRRDEICVKSWIIDTRKSDDYKNKVEGDMGDILSKMDDNAIIVMEDGDNIYVNWELEASNYDDPEGYIPDDVKPITKRNDRITRIISCGRNRDERVYVVHVEGKQRDESIEFKLKRIEANMLRSPIYSLYRIN